MLLFLRGSFKAQHQWGKNRKEGFVQYAVADNDMLADNMWYDVSFLPERRFSAHKETFPPRVINNRVERAINGILRSWDKAPGRQTLFQFPVKNEFLQCRARLSKCEGNSILSIPRREKLSIHQATVGILLWWVCFTTSQRKETEDHSEQQRCRHRSRKSRGSVKERCCFSFLFLVFLFLNDQINKH